MNTVVQDYWNKVDRACKSGKGVICDNWEKRRVLGEALLKYPLYGARIVELGSGAGVTPTIVACGNGHIKYTGIDISEKYAETARKTFGLNIIVHDMTEGLPFADNSVDVIFAFDTLEHIHSDHRPKLWKEIDRILAEDRIIFINNPLDNSKHDPAFDFELDETDIAELCATTGTKILECKLLQSEANKYQFFVLGQVIKK